LHILATRYAKKYLEVAFEKKTVMAKPPVTSNARVSHLLYYRTESKGLESDSKKVCFNL